MGKFMMLLAIIMLLVVITSLVSTDLNLSSCNIVKKLLANEVVFYFLQQKKTKSTLNVSLNIVPKMIHDTVAEELNRV